MNTGLPSTFLSCDWGTSRFRLRLVATENLEVLAETETDDGVGKLGRTDAAETAESRYRRFAAYLAAHGHDLTSRNRERPACCVVSGMASSNIGMQELAYAALPFDASGRELRCARIDIDHSLHVLLVSGVRGDADVMRGEEAQAVGLAGLIDIEQPGVLLLPGTHSKHLRFSDGRFCNFRTFMTGELFETLSRHTILAGSLRTQALNEDGNQAYLEGVRQGAAEGLCRSLFAVRAGELLGRRDQSASGQFLSGLLVGSELAYLAEGDERIWLAAAEALSGPYWLALTTLLPGKRLERISPPDLEKALLAGHRKLLELHFTCTPGA